MAVAQNVPPGSEADAGADDATASGEADAGSTPGADASGIRFHPSDFASPTVHGHELKLQTQDCRTCHGATLSGGIGPSCDSCHQAEWRTTCTYCHGGTDTMTGAPPRGIRGETARDMLTFRPHTEHGTVRNHAAFDCVQCHTKPTDVLSMGHIFDDTHGVAEVTFTAGLSPSGTWSNGGCASLYCHGNGRTSAGQIAHTDARPRCDGCHPGPASGNVRWLTMSGEHRKHMAERMQCGECHGATVDLAATSITNPDNHVNGVKEVTFNVAGFTRSANGTCTGTCHTERHVARAW